MISSRAHIAKTRLLQATVRNLSLTLFGLSLFVSCSTGQRRETPSNTSEKKIIRFSVFETHESGTELMKKLSPLRCVIQANHLQTSQSSNGAQTEEVIGHDGIYTLTLTREKLNYLQTAEFGSHRSIDDGMHITAAEPDKLRYAQVVLYCGGGFRISYATEKILIFYADRPGKIDVVRKDFRFSVEFDQPGFQLYQPYRRKPLQNKDIVLELR